MLLNQRLKKYTIILASQSPRRQHLLKEMGIDFEVRTNGNSDESYPENLDYTEIPVFLARKKAEPFTGKLLANEILITSDTIVYCNGSIIGKPTNRQNAIDLLKQLSGRKHVVVTGIEITHPNHSRSFSAFTDVYFRKLSEDEIEFYVDTFKPYDKAGAYGIQEWIGYIGVERIDGSYFNVMGLPVQKLYMELNHFIDELEENK